jgi:hypothetical protein
MVLLDARREDLFGVAQVTHDLLGGQLVGGAGEALQAVLARPPGAVFHRQHVGARLVPIVDAAGAPINYLEGKYPS